MLMSLKIARATAECLHGSSSGQTSTPPEELYTHRQDKAHVLTGEEVVNPCGASWLT